MHRGNYRARFWTDPRAQISPSLTAGHGLFAVEPIRAGEVVEIMGGIVLTEAEFQTFQAETSRYNAMQIGEGLHLVEPPEITAARRGSINHSCDSNLWMDDEVTVIARHDIAAGEELTVDWTMPSSPRSPTGGLTASAGAVPPSAAVSSPVATGSVLTCRSAMTVTSRRS
jgi:SET domain-containing protein